MANPREDGSDAVVVLTTTPDASSAERLARSLVEARLAACVSRVSAVQSVYRWKGQVHDDAEVLLLIKTRRSLLSRIEAHFASGNHPYEVPELLALPVVAGGSAYLAWLIAETEDSPQP
ncbi:MAG: divalent-cation tolerance protein CutA [Myxococcota bacterium]|nr:divalent-cation tolerance protein CutA [Myxococcota bacterium]MDW8363704.1 divalent-cation tolerance protein CutA [Myxococcales bacterium]